MQSGLESIVTKFLVEFTKISTLFFNVKHRKESWKNMHKANIHGSTPTHIRFFRNARQLTDCSDFCILLTGSNSDCTSLSRLLQVISSKEIMAFKVCVYCCFIPTKRNIWQEQRGLPLFLPALLPPSCPLLSLKNFKPESPKSVDPLNKSQQASVQGSPSEEFRLPCLFSWRGSFLSLAADSALFLGFVKPKSPFPLSNIAAIYCHILITWVTCQNIFQQLPASNPKCLCKPLWIYFPWMKELIQKTSTKA